MSTISYFEERIPSQSKCRLCNGDCTKFGKIESFVDNFPPLEFVLCKNCQSISFGNEIEIIGYSSKEFSPEEYYRHYTHVGAGISAMIDPLELIDIEGDLLDVGCGFGYVVDYWTKIKKFKAVGLETADYGKKGKQILNAQIYHSLLGNCPSIDESFFDIVYSSEVVEHTIDPLNFCTSLRNRCKQDGVVVLTTPSSRAVLEENSESVKIAALSPYFHYFIASKNGLQQLLYKAGFNHIEIFDNGTRLFAWASVSPLPSIRESKKFYNWDDYFRYLEILSNNNDIDVSSGALYRLFKDQWLTGVREEAYRNFRTFEKLILKNFGINLRTLSYLEYEKYISENNLKKAPAWLPLSLHVGSMIILKMEHDRPVALRMAISSEKIIEILLSKAKFRQYSQEAEHFFPKVIDNRMKLERFNLAFTLSSMLKKFRLKFSANHT